MFVIRRIFFFAKRTIASFGTKSSPFVFFFRRCYKKFLIACFAKMSFSCFLILIETWKRTITAIGMFKSRFKKLNFNSASFAVSSNSRNFKGFVSTFFRTKAFFLIFNSMCCYLKKCFTYSTFKNATSFFEFILANCRTEKMFVLFNFIGISFKRFIALGTMNNHRLEYSL